MAARFSAPDFCTFASGKLTYDCDYSNFTGRTIRTGSSVVTDEVCMAIGLFFPSTAPVLCFNNLIVP